MASVAAPLSTPFAAVTGQHVRFSDGLGTGTAGDDQTGRKGRMSTRLSSLVLDDAFDNLLPLSPSLDNFLNLATTCMNGQALLPGRLFSSSGGRSLSAMGSLDLNWINEGAIMEEAGRLADEEHRCDDMDTSDPHHPDAAAATDCGFQFHGQPVVSGSSYPAPASAPQQPAASYAQLPTPPPLLLHCHPVTSGAPGLHTSPHATNGGSFSPHTPGSALATSAGEGACTMPRSPHANLSATVGASSVQQVHQAEQQYPSVEQNVLFNGGAQGPPTSPFLQGHLAAAQAYHQQMLAYLQQAGSGAGVDPDLLAQYSSGTGSTQMAWNGVNNPEASSFLAQPSTAYSTSVAAAAYAQQAAAAACNVPLPESPMTPHTPSAAKSTFMGSPLTPESAMAAAQQAQQVKHADAWVQHLQQMELWCQQQQVALMQAYTGSGWGLAGSMELGCLGSPSSSWGAHSGLMPTPYGPGQLAATQQQGALPFQLRVSTMPSFKVSTVSPVKLSHTTPTITVTPNK